MTTFSYPVNIKQREPDGSTVGNVAGTVPTYYRVVVSVGQTGTAVGATTIPLFVAPVGSRPHDAFVDVLTVFNPAASNTNLRVGVPTSTGIIFAATTVNTAGRRTAAWTGAQVSANAIPFTVPTTIEAVVSIDTSTVTTGEVAITVVLL